MKLLAVLLLALAVCVVACLAGGHHDHHISYAIKETKKVYHVPKTIYESKVIPVHKKVYVPKTIKSHKIITTSKKVYVPKYATVKEFVPIISHHESYGHYDDHH